jgi:uroporphyrinogen-III synthase
MLRGRRIVITRAEGQSAPLAERLRDLGADVSCCPTIAIRPPLHIAALDDTIQNLEGFDWVVFTSANAVNSVADRRRQLGVPGTLGLVRVAAIGAATSRALQEHGIAIHCVPVRFTSAALVEAIGEVRGLRILLPRSDLADASLPDALRARGARVHEVVAYRTAPAVEIAELANRLAQEAVDAIVFTSPSTVRYFLDGLRASGTLDHLFAGESRPAIICIGPTTAAAVSGLAGSLVADLVAEKHDDDGLVDAIVRWSRAQPRSALA